MVAALAVGLTACNKDKKTAPAKANNAETLGTAIAVAMNSSAAGTASAEGDENVDPYFTIKGIPGISLATNEIAKYLNEYVNNAKAYIKDHNVDVKVEASNEKDGYNYKMLVTVTYKDAEGKDVSDVSTIYINAKKIKDGEVSKEDADINGKNDFAINGTAAVVVVGSVNVNVDINGIAKYVPGEPEVENGKYVVQVSGNASVQVG